MGTTLLSKCDANMGKAYAAPKQPAALEGESGVSSSVRGVSSFSP